MCLAEARHDFVDAFDAGSGKQFGGAGASLGGGVRGDRLDGQRGDVQDVAGILDLDVDEVGRALGVAKGAFDESCGGLRGLCGGDDPFGAGNMRPSAEARIFMEKSPFMVRADILPQLPLDMVKYSHAIR